MDHLRQAHAGASEFAATAQNIRETPCLAAEINLGEEREDAIAGSGTPCRAPRSNGRLPPHPRGRVERLPSSGRDLHPTNALMRRSGEALSTDSPHCRRASRDPLTINFLGLWETPVSWNDAAPSSCRMRMRADAVTAHKRGRWRKIIIDRVSGIRRDGRRSGRGFKFLFLAEVGRRPDLKPSRDRTLVSTPKRRGRAPD